MNVYEMGKQKCIPAVMIFLRNEKDELLMIYRNRKENDFHEGKWNGLGGKCEFGETLYEAAIRETFEESGFKLSINDLKFLGILHFPNFKPHKNEDWLCTIFTSKIKNAKIIDPSICTEGELHWIPKDQILNRPLWEGDKIFLPHVINEEQFVGTFFYENKKLLKHDIHLLR